MKSEEEKKILEVLDQIRPYLNSEGGDVEFIKYEREQKASLRSRKARRYEDLRQRSRNVRSRCHSLQLPHS